MEGSEAGRSRAKPKVTEVTLTAETLKQHTRSYRSASPQDPGDGVGKKPESVGSAKQPTGTWKLLQTTEAGVTKMELQSYDGLAIDDILEVDPGTDVAGVTTVTEVGFIYLSGLTCFGHGPGAAVRRLIEGTGARWTAAASEANATPTSISPSGRRFA